MIRSVAGAFAVQRNAMPKLLCPTVFCNDISGLLRQSYMKESDNTDNKPKIERKWKKNRGTGDKGQSSLFTGERRWKDDRIFEALGATDELSAAIGKMRHMCNEAGLFDVTEKLIDMQCTLQDIGAHIATPLTSKTTEMMRKHTQFDIAYADELDEWIDYYANDLPPLKMFILAGGNLLSSCMHEARCICRRAERSLIPLLREGEVDRAAVQYLNRLSDLLFVLGRYVCHKTNDEEIAYKKKLPRTTKGSNGTSGKDSHDWKKYKV
uniref:Corrinoid adenosyltransferase MMAB n=1 Tax=Trichuris muris TaxID=70415 RepID=A0A5S6QHX3_TRIMR